MLTYMWISAFKSIITKLQSVDSQRLGIEEGTGGEHIDLPGRGKWNTFYWWTAGGWGQEWRGGYEDEKWQKQRESARIEEPVRGSGSPNIYASNASAVSK